MQAKENRISRQVKTYFGAVPFKKVAENKFPGGKLLLLEGGGKSVLVTKKTIFKRGQPVGAFFDAWKAVPPSQ